jgi:proteic killer suppression protein
MKKAAQGPGAETPEPDGRSDTGTAEQSHRVSGSVLDALREALRMLSSSARLGDLRSPPGNRLEALSGDRAGQHSIRINDQWRLCFVWRDGHAWDVAIVDYH